MKIPIDYMTLMLELQKQVSQVLPKDKVLSSRIVSNSKKLTRKKYNKIE